MKERVTTRNGQAAGRAASSFDNYGGSAPENYERYFVPAIGAPLAANLVELAALEPGERVLDVACGTGVVAGLAAEKVGSTGTVTGLDANPGMLTVARSVAAPGTAIEWSESDAEATTFPDAAYDVALCQMGLQFFADTSAALREMRRVLTPGGRLVASVPGPMPRIFGILEQALRDHVSPDTASFVSVVFSLSETRELEGLLDDAGFGDISVRRRTESLRLPPPTEFLWQYVWSTPLATVVASLDEHDRASLEREVVARWERFTDGGTLVLELGVVVATARARRY